jgi:hypothetical protein
MRKSDRYNPPWERYTGANYTESGKAVKHGCLLTSECNIYHFALV